MYGNIETLVSSGSPDDKAAYDRITEELAAIAETVTVPDSRSWLAFAQEMNVRAERADALLKELGTLVPLLNVPVADGSATYAVLDEDEDWMVFLWMYGGLDRYSSPFGAVIAIPIEDGRTLLARACALNEIFGGD